MLRARRLKITINTASSNPISTQDFSVLTHGRKTQLLRLCSCLRIHLAAFLFGVVCSDTRKTGMLLTNTRLESQHRDTSHGCYRPRHFCTAKWFAHFATISRMQVCAGHEPAPTSAENNREMHGDSAVAAISGSSLSAKNGETTDQTCRKHMLLCRCQNCQ